MTVSSSGSQPYQPEEQLSEKQAFENQAVDYKNKIINGSYDIDKGLAFHKILGDSDRITFSELLKKIKTLFAKEITDLETERKNQFEKYGFNVDENSFKEGTSILTIIICFLNQYTIFGSINKIEKAISRSQIFEDKLGSCISQLKVRS